jgi:tetratricopeptide (TPR) repeat protein
MVDRSEGVFSFEDMVMEGAAEVKAQILPGQIILEAARRLQAPEIVAKVLGDVDRPLLMSAHARAAVQKLTLSPTDGFLLSRIDGTLSAREIFQIIPLPQEDVERSLFALLCTGTVEYGTRTVSTRGRSADGERKLTPPDARREPPPPAQAAPPAPPAPAAPPPPPEAVAELPSDEAQMAQARESVVKAEELLAEGRAQDAIAELGPALVLLLGDESIRARVALARAYMTMPKLRGRAEGVLTEAIRDSPKDPVLHVLLGRLHAQRGNRDAAIASLKKALDLAPGHGEAQAELDAVMAEAPQDAAKTGRAKRG